MTESGHSSPYITLWYKPGPTVKGLIGQAKGGRSALWIAASFGFLQIWPRFTAQAEPQFGLLLSGLVAGMLGLYFFSWLLRNFGRWFGGEAKLAEVRTALGWGLLPWTVLFALMLLFITLKSADAQKIFLLFFGVIVYGFVILLTTLSAALRISHLKTFFCLILTLLVSVFPMTLILQLLMGSLSVAP